MTLSPTRRNVLLLLLALAAALVLIDFVALALGAFICLWARCVGLAGRASGIGGERHCAGHPPSAHPPGDVGGRKRLAVSGTGLQALLRNPWRTPTFWEYRAARHSARLGFVDWRTDGISEPPTAFVARF